jgi:hypothetical protein
MKDIAFIADHHPTVTAVLKLLPENISMITAAENAFTVGQ